VLAAIERLRFEAESETRHRRPLRAPVKGLPETAWQLRVGAYRALYRINDERTVRVLRVILKGTRTTDAAVRRSSKP